MLKVDYVGIAIMISGSTFAPFYYGLICEQHNFLLYSGIVLFFCFLAAVAIMSQSYWNSEAAWISALAFIIAGLSTIPGLVYMSLFIDEKRL